MIRQSCPQNLSAGKWFLNSKSIPVNNVSLEVLSKLPLQNHHAASWQHVVFDGGQNGVFCLPQESLKSFYPPKSPRMLQFCPFPLRHCGIFAMDSHCNPWCKTKGQKQRNLRKTYAILDIICHRSEKNFRLGGRASKT